MELIPNLTTLPMWGIFMITAFALNKLVFQPTLVILKERQRLTVEMDKNARYFAEQTEIKLKEYESLMNDAKNLAREKREEIIKAAMNEQQEILKKARGEAEDYLNEFKSKIQTEANQARAELKSQVESLASEITRKLTQKEAA